MSAETSFGSWLKDQRKRLDLTQDELAQRVGCSLMLIQKIEADERRPSKQIAELLAACLGVPADERTDFSRFARSRLTSFASTDAAPWRTLRLRVTNLPVPPSPLFGRQNDIEVILRCIEHQQYRLLTLIGPPGIGKTRLALACASAMLDHFEGVYWVALAPLHDPELVPSTIARALGIQEVAGRSFLQILTEHLASRRLLLLLDNFEQVVAAAPFVADLLANCPWLQLLVTSRASLHIRAERQFRVTPLASPEATTADNPQRLLASPAVQWFVDRAQAADPSFELLPANAGAVAEICARLDGLPLAIELVATRMGVLSPHELLVRMDRRLALLTGGPQDLPVRHQTLRDAIAWSYDLLEATEQQLFARLGVFIGGFNWDEAEAVCGSARLLSRLIDQSLLVREDERYAMLETLRDYALERLAESGAESETRSRHADCFLRLAESAVPELTGTQQRTWLDRLELEHHNLRAALRWTIDTRNALMALRMSGALWRFWQTRGYLTEGLNRLRAALSIEPAHDDSALASARAQALLGVGWLSRDFGDFAEMKNCFESALAMLGRFNPDPRRAFALYSAGYANFLIGDYTGGIRTIEESVALYRVLDDEEGITLALFMLGRISVGRGEYGRAETYLTESLRVEEKRGATFGKARTLGSLGELAIYRGQPAAAAAYLEESQKILDQLGERQLSTWVLTKRGELAWSQGELAHARVFLEKSLEISRAIGYRWNTAYTLTYCGMVALGEGDVERAQSLCEASRELFRELGSESDVAQTNKDLARIMLCRGNYASAATLYAECLCVLEQRSYLPDVAECLEGLASGYGAMGQLATAARLLGAAEALRERIQSPLFPVRESDYLRAVAHVRTQLDEETFRQMWEEGRTMALEDLTKSMRVSAGPLSQE